MYSDWSEHSVSLKVSTIMRCMSKMVGNKITNNKQLPIFLISQGIAVSQKEDKHIEELYSISNVEWGGYNKDAELLTVIDCQGRLEGRSDQTSQVKCD